MKIKQINIRVDIETYKKLKEVSPEENISLFVRMLIKKELERLKNNKD